LPKVDDYELYEKDYAEFIRRGMESFGLEDHPGNQKGRDERWDT
jgi:hypothetical protein